MSKNNIIFEPEIKTTVIMKNENLKLEELTIEEKIKEIRRIVDEYGSFNMADVSADHSPVIEDKSSLHHLVEDIGDKLSVDIYDSRGETPISTYDADLEDLDEDNLTYVLELAYNWAEICIEDQIE